LINIVCTLWSFLKSHCANVSIQHYYNAEQRLVEVIGTREILRHTNGSSKPRERQFITFKMNVFIQRTKFVLWFSREHNHFLDKIWFCSVSSFYIHITQEEYYFLLSMIVLRALTHKFTVLSSANE